MNGYPPERRAPFVIDEAKFSTQRIVTYLVLLIFATVTVNILLGQDQAERSTIIQTVINLTLLAVGYWLGSSKQAIDSAASASRIAEAQPPRTTQPPATIKAEDVTVAAQGDVTVNEKP